MMKSDEENLESNFDSEIQNDNQPWTESIVNLIYLDTKNETKLNTTSNGIRGHGSIVYLEVIGVLYTVGIVGSFLALLHLYRKRNYKNTKQAFMLK